VQNSAPGGKRAVQTKSYSLKWRSSQSSEIYDFQVPRALITEICTDLRFQSGDGNCATFTETHRFDEYEVELAC